MAELKARSSHVGARRTCPRCQFRLKVPSAEEAARLATIRQAAGEYSFGDSDAPPAEAQQYISVRCHVCMTRMDATLDQVGQEIVCPDCGTAAVVPPPKPPPQEKTPPVNPGDGEEYAICEGVDQPDATHKLVYQAYTHFPCPRCGTRMFAAMDQVGQEVVCPDCRLATIVPPLAGAPPAPDPADVDRKRHEEYALTPTVSPDTGSSARGPSETPNSSGVPPDESRSGRPTYVKVECPHCHTRLPATSDQVGSQIVCPDCGTTTMVPEPKLPASAAAAETERAEEYAVEEPIVTPEYRHVEDYRLPESERPVPGGTANAASPAAAAEARPPQSEFSSSIFGFLLYPGVWQRWVALSAGAVAVLLVLAVGVGLAMQPAYGLGDSPIVVGAMAFVTIAGVLGLVWFAPAAAIWLVVVEETSEGSDQIDGWPEAIYTDWMFNALFIFNSLGAATFLGVMLRGALRECAGVVFWPAMPITIIVLFPVLLLSMMETGSALNPVSWPIWRSVRSAWWAWLAFYLESGLLTALGVGLTAAAAWVAGLWGVAVFAPLLVALTLIYARLLGRLGWVSRSVAAEQAAAEEAAEDA